MADAAALRATLGVAPGSVTPLGLVNARPMDLRGELRVVLDAALAESAGLVWFHPLVNTASPGLKPADLPSFPRGSGHAVAVPRPADERARHFRWLVLCRLRNILTPCQDQQRWK